MRLPLGPFYLVGRAGGNPADVETLHLEEDGHTTVALFTQRAIAEEYQAAFPLKGWKVVEVPRDRVVTFLAVNFQAGVVGVAIDPKPNAPANVVAIFRVILESE